MRRSSRALKLVAAGLFLTCTSVVADKPNSSNCPCWNSDPGILDSIVTIAQTSCVTQLFSQNLMTKKNYKFWTFAAITPAGMPCIEFHLVSNPENESCHVVAGTSTGGLCGDNLTYTSIYDLSRDQEKNCKLARDVAVEYLSETAMCD